MEKTIKEMADNCYYRHHAFAIESYIEGANDVLDEIDTEIDRLLYNNGREVDYEDVVMMIRERIYELKGE